MIEKEVAVAISIIIESLEDLTLANLAHQIIRKIAITEREKAHHTNQEKDTIEMIETEEEIEIVLLATNNFDLLVSLNWLWWLD